MPIHEINERFTKSEIYMMAWRSQEQHHHFKKKMKGHDKGRSRSSEDGGRYNYGSDAVIPEGLPDKFFAQEIIRDKHGKIIATPGELNLSQVTGTEARKYMATIGMPFPEIRSVVPRR